MEISVSVEGRGRVLSGLPGIDCPTQCGAHFVFKDAAAAAGSPGVTLRAIATPGVRFAGWKFDPELLGTRGRGPSQCIPVKRAASQPSVDGNAAEITLPYGEIAGTPPPGQEGSCGAFTTVPVAYRVTATFEDIPVVDGGDAGDAGTGEVLYEPPALGAIGEEIGISGGNYLYWKWRVGGAHGISYGIPTSPGFTPQVLVQPTLGITRFEVDSNAVVYQRSDDALFAIQAGSSPVALPGASACAAVAADFSGAYCRTAGPNGSIFSWTLAGTGPTLVHTGVPQGTDLVADSIYFYLSDDQNGVGGTGTIMRTTKTATGDAGATFTSLVTGRSNPTGLEVNSRLFWLELNTLAGTGTAHANASSSSSISYTSVPALAGLKHLAIDTSSLYVWVATPTAIYRANYTGSQLQTLRTGLSGVGGIAVDSSYVYWTQSDGRVYRAFKNDFQQ